MLKSLEAGRANEVLREAKLFQLQRPTVKIFSVLNTCIKIILNKGEKASRDTLKYQDAIIIIKERWGLRTKPLPFSVFTYRTGQQVKPRGTR